MPRFLTVDYFDHCGVERLSSNTFSPVRRIFHLSVHRSTQTLGARLRSLYSGVFVDTLFFTARTQTATAGYLCWSECVCVNIHTMLLVWFDQLDLVTRDHITRIDPRSHYWPRSRHYNIEYDFSMITEWYISFSLDQLGFQFVLCYPERVQIIESHCPRTWRCRAV